VPHRRKAPARPDLPIHVTLRVRYDRPRLRNGRAYRVIERAFFRLVVRCVRVLAFGFSGDHFHCILERGPLSDERLLKGFASMVAKGLNRIAGMRGRALADRSHVRVLRTPAQAWLALRYVLRQGVHHRYCRTPQDDAYSSLRAVLSKRPGFLTCGLCWVWRKLGMAGDERWRTAHPYVAAPEDDSDELAVMGLGPPNLRRASVRRGAQPLARFGER
jgi:hypothetical protein